MVLEAGINAAADALVTFKRQEFRQVPARFGIARRHPRSWMTE